MKDLVVLTADADMQAVFRAILARPDALGIRTIDFEVDRHPGRDSGVFKSGSELLRAKPKNDFRYFIAAFDHDGSGCHRRWDESGQIIQQRLDSFTFKDRSTVVVIAPELEEWLWRDPPSISGASDADRALAPKERLNQVFVKNRKRPARIQDFAEIAARANLAAWNSSPSFRILKETLQNWFPAT